MTGAVMPSTSADGSPVHGSAPQWFAGIKTMQGRQDALESSPVRETIGTLVRCIEASLEQIALSMMAIECTPLLQAQEQHYDMLQRIENSARKLKSEVVLAREALQRHGSSEADGLQCRPLDIVEVAAQQRREINRSFAEFYRCKWMIQTVNQAEQNLSQPVPVEM